MTTTTADRHVATARELAEAEAPRCSSCERPVNPFTGECTGCSD